MSDENDVIEKEAKHGEKMIEVKIRFWTNNIAEEEGKIVPKHAWSSGVVRIESNASHDIKPGKPIPFHSLMDMNAVIEEVLIKQGITLHTSRNLRKYVTSE